MKLHFDNSFQLIFDEEKASIISLKKGSHELIHELLPFFSLRLRDKDNSCINLSSFDFDFINRKGNYFNYSNEFVDIELYLNRVCNGLDCKIDIKNKTKYVIEWVELNSFGLNPKLADEDYGEGKILFPYNEGCIVSNMARRNASPFPYIDATYPSLGKYAIFPNMVSSQFICYLEEGYGIYFGLHDKDRGTKQIDFKSNKESLSIVNRIYTGCDYSSSYKMDFLCSLRFFCGDIYDGIDFYKRWFSKNKIDGLKRIEENPDLPKWYFSSPIVLAYPLRGRFDTDKMEPNGFIPLENGLPIINGLSKDLDSPVLSLLMHYEGTAPWAPPYVFPPFMGEKEFTHYVKLTHENGNFVGLYCSGLGYTIQSNLIKEYNKEKEFKDKRYDRLMCSNSDSSLSSSICTAQRKGYDICPCLDEAKHLFSDEISKLDQLGIDYIQALDQNHGGNSYFCYSSKHGHPPVPGSWQQKEVNKTLDLIKKRKEVLLGCESAAAEPFIGKLLFSDNRYNLNYYIGMPFPIYSYLYHPYLNNFMGNGICNTLSKERYNYPYKVAYSFICGDMLTGVINDKGDFNYSWCELETTNKEDAVSVLRNLNAFRKGVGKKYLLFGEMVRPIQIEAKMVDFKTEDGTQLEVPCIQTAAYRYNGKKMQFVANFLPEEVLIGMEKKHKVFPNPKDDDFIIAKEVKIKPFSAIMVQI